MAKTKKHTNTRALTMRHRGRSSQVLIYFGKFLRIFIYQNDWKVLPMAAVIAGMVSLVIRNGFHQTMEGTLIGALALACVSLWNGCFNSIQVICRERGIIKREHRSGMHVSAYVIAHLLFQAIICACQAGITLYVCHLAGVQLSGEGLFTDLMIVDMGITLFLITYASDVLCLFISAIVHTPMAAMTIMPFVLIFQLVFSGGFFTLPEKLTRISDYTISNYGLQCIAAQARYNELPMMSGWTTLNKMRNSKVEGDVTIEDAIDYALTNDSEIAKDALNTQITSDITAEDILKDIKQSPNYDEYKDESFHYGFTVGDVIDLFGRERVKDTVTERGREAAWNRDYELSVNNIIDCWFKLGLFAVVFAVLTVIALEFIDKDKR